MPKNLCKINTSTKRCSKTGTVDAHKCEVAPSGRCRKLKTQNKPKPKTKQKPMPIQKSKQICKINTNTKRCSKTGTIDAHKCEVAPSGRCKKINTLVKKNQKCIRDISTYSMEDKLVANISSSKLYDSVINKYESFSGKTKDKNDWGDLMSCLSYYELSGSELVKCESRILISNINEYMKIVGYTRKIFTLRLYNKLKKHVYSLFERVEDSKTQIDKDYALLILSDVQKYIKVKKLDHSESFKYFKGCIITELAFLISILKRHKNDCVVINLHENNGLPSATDKAGRWYNMKGLFKQVKECAKRKKFAVIPFTLGKKGKGHMNIIIYNPLTDTFEHYEPYGQKYYSVDEKIYRTKYKKKFEGTITINTKYYAPMDTSCILPVGYGTHIGIQKESNEEDLNGEELAIYKYTMTDPGGYCVAYSMYIADQRLSNPNMKPEEVYLKALQDASGKSYKILRVDNSNRKYTREIVSFIRQYARTYLEVMHDCMDIFSTYVLLRQKKWDDLTSTEKKAANYTYYKLYDNMRQKLLEYSG